MSSDAHEGYIFPISYKTSAVLLIVKSDRSLLGDTGKKNLYLKGKTSLSFVKWVFRYGQPVRDSLYMNDKAFFLLYNYKVNLYCDCFSVITGYIQYVKFKSSCPTNMILLSLLSIFNGSAIGYRIRLCYQMRRQWQCSYFNNNDR